MSEREQEQKLRDLVPVQSIGVVRHFVEPESGKQWMLYWPRSEEHGSGPRFLRRGTIPSDAIGWAVELLCHGNEEDAIGAGTDLSSRPETWAALLDRLEAKRETLPFSHTRAFINNLGVLQSTNLRPVVGKSGEEIEADASHFRELAKRASVLVSVS